MGFNSAFKGLNSVQVQMYNTCCTNESLHFNCTVDITYV